MTSMRECVEHLTKDIGPRPVGTDEEQKAALYIKGIYEQGTNLDVELDEFSAPINTEALRAALCALVFLSAIMAIVSPSLIIASFVISLVSGVLFILDEFRVFSLAPYLGKAPSQNVIAKFLPYGEQAISSKKKKIVVVTNYDTTKVKSEFSGFFGKYLNFIKYFEVGGIALVILSTLFAVLAGRSGVVNFLLFIGILASALPIASFVLHKLAKYNEGANNNASSVAVMAEVAKRLATGVYASHGEVPVVHGRKVAEKSDVIPEGAEVSWTEEIKEAQNEGSFQDMSQESAQNVVQSMMFSNKRNLMPNTPQTEESEQSEPKEDEAEIESFNEIETQIEPVQIEAKQDENVPSWFAKGRQNALKGAKSEQTGGANGHVNVKRSVFATAFEETERLQREAYENDKITNNQAISNSQALDHRLNSDSQEGRTQAILESNEDLADRLRKVQRDIDESGIKAVERTREDSKIAKNVIDKEVSEEGNSEVEIVDTVCSETIDASQQQAEDEKAIDEVPELKPLEGEEGIGVDEYYKLENNNTEPLPIKKMQKEETSNESVPVSESSKANNSQKREIKLPSLTGPIPFVENSKKRVSGDRALKNSSSDKDENKEGKLNRSLLPSLDDSHRQEASLEAENRLLSNAGTFDVGQATGTFAPITDADLLRANEGEDSLYVHDVDDRIYQEETTVAGVVAGDGYVDMPQSHAESMFGRLFHKNKEKKKKDDSSLSSSIGVDDSWDARKAGSELGTWDEYDNDSWNGGSVTVPGDFEDNQIYENVEQNDEKPILKDLASDSREEIYRFATNDIRSEVWFVNLGAQYARGAGMAQFLKVNDAELSDATFIVIEASGAGTPAQIDRSGIFRRVTTEARQKRFARNAARNLGLTLKNVKNLPLEGIEVALQRRKVIHLAGMGTDLPFNLHSINDTLEDVSEEAMQISSNLLIELLREI